MRSTPAHIWTCCMQLGVREKKNVCKSTWPEKSSLGPCSINSLNLLQDWSIPSSSLYVKVITCLLRCWTLLIRKNFSQNFFVNLFQLPSTSKDANEYHVFDSPQVSRERDSIWTIHRELLLDVPCCIASWNVLRVYTCSPQPSFQMGLSPPSRWSWLWFHTQSLRASNPTLILLCLHIED
jgi:hypothetical protein